MSSGPNDAVRKRAETFPKKFQMWNWVLDTIDVAFLNAFELMNKNLNG